MAENSVSESPSAAELEAEIAALQHTLQVRRAQTSEAVQKAIAMEDMAAALRRESLQTSGTSSELNRLTQQLSRHTATNNALRSEAAELCQSIMLAKQKRADLRNRRLDMLNTVALLSSEAAALCLKAQNEAPPPVPSNSFIFEEHDKLLASLQRAEKEVAEETERLQQVHKHCLDEVAKATLERQLERRSLEAKWQSQRELLIQQRRAILEKRGVAVIHEGTHDTSLAFRCEEKKSVSLPPQAPKPSAAKTAHSLRSVAVRCRQTAP